MHFAGPLPGPLSRCSQDRSQELSRPLIRDPRIACAHAKSPYLPHGVLRCTSQDRSQVLSGERSQDDHRITESTAQDRSSAFQRYMLKVCISPRAPQAFWPIQLLRPVILGALLGALRRALRSVRSVIQRSQE